MKCDLDKDINECPFFVRDTEECKSNNKCSYQGNAEQSTKYVRKERWYEKYYKK